MICLKLEMPEMPKSCSVCWQRCLCSNWVVESKLYKTERAKKCPLFETTSMEEARKLLVEYKYDDKDREEILDKLGFKDEGK